FKPIKVLKGTFRTGAGAAVPRRCLVVIQFTASVILIIGTVVVYRQVQFARNRPVGYSKQGLIIFRPYSSEYHDHFNSMRNDLLATGAVTSMAESGNSITRESSSGGGLEWKGKDPNMRDEFTTVGVSSDYGRTVGWQFVEGRDFVHQSMVDSNALKSIAVYH